ncbi:hypothetical protein RHECNPAF_2940021 [Rhizobium etli CNPAF512]|nr:hypothetical protein RHECNPAF_2940021 [Rhizobium etli CNPAF512]
MLLKRGANLQIRSLRFRSLFSRMPLPQNRCTLLRDMLQFRFGLRLSSRAMIFSSEAISSLVTTGTGSVAIASSTSCDIAPLRIAHSSVSRVSRSAFSCA